MEPVIKVRYKGLVRNLSFTFLLLTTVVVGKSMGAFPKCDKTPKETTVPKIVGSNGYAVAIVGSPLKYRPNQVYTISLKNTDDVEQIKKFQSFLLVAEPTMEISADREVSLGSFQLIPGDAMVKFSHRCSNAVEATSSISKEAVSVFWQAPPPNTGCIDFKAMIEERQDVWYSDDDLLTYTLCEDDSPMEEPPMVQPCCACNEAKYELIFEGVWSRHTHPKDFPRNEWRTEFSPIIGASHSVNYSLWEIGRLASPSLSLLGEVGYTANLEKDMKRYSPHIRSVIKAHGLEQRSNVMHQTFAVFRVDPIHHLVSFVTKMIPSPDWIVGLSKENICLANCSWVAHRVIDLYPWDIGTQSGLRYESPNMPTRPRQPIQRITSSNPNNPESPFYDRTFAPIKPVARIHMIRQREYIKNCPPGKRRPGSREKNMRNPNNNNNNNLGITNPWTNTNNQIGSQLYPGSNDNLGGYNNIGDNSQGGYSNLGGDNNNQYGGQADKDPYGNQGFGQSPGYNGNSYVYGEGIGAPLDTERYGIDNNVGDQSNYNYERVNAANNYDTTYKSNNDEWSNPNAGYDPYENRDTNINIPDPVDSYGATNPGYDTGSPYENTWDQDTENNDNFNTPYGNNDLNGLNGKDVCAVTSWGNWDECSATCGTGSQNRMREYINTLEASMNSCQESLLDKKPCYLPECQGVSYDSQDNSFNPFTIDDQAVGGNNNGYNWEGRGLRSDGLVSKNPLSYSYETGNQAPPYNYQNGMQNFKSPLGMPTYGSNNLGSMRSENNYGASYIYGERDSNGVLDTPSYSGLNQNLQGDSTIPNCEVTSWGMWSDCNTDCGPGIRTRTRRYSDPTNSASCMEELDDEDVCYGNADSCIDGKANYEPAEDTRFTKWHSQSTFEMPNSGQPNENVRMRNRHNPINQFSDQACDVAEWSKWSPCSKKCGNGRRQRTRLFKVPFVPDRNCDVRLIDAAACVGRDPSCEPSYDYEASSFYGGSQNDIVDNNYEHEMGLQDDEQINEFVVKPLNLKRGNSVNQSKNNNNNNKVKQWASSDKKAGCHLEPDPGPCNGHFNRWYYDQESGSCKIFSFRGCQGNSNNFATNEKCMHTCATANSYSTYNSQKSYPDNQYELFGQTSSYLHDQEGKQNDPFKRLQSLSSVKVEDGQDHFNIDDYPVAEQDLTPVDCVVSSWTDWSSCSVSCGSGWVKRRRDVLVGPKNNGKSCPKKLERKRKCQKDVCPDTKYWYRGSWRHMVSNEDLRPD